MKAGFKKYWWLLALLGALAGGVAIVRPWESTPEETPTTQTAPLSVRTIKAQREAIRSWVSSEGRVRAAKYKHLTFEVEGDVTYLARRNGRRLREGDTVKQGELLARVDDRELVADVRQAEAAIAEARKQRAASAAQVAQAQSQVSQARSQVSQAQSQVQNARSQVQKAQTARNLAATNLERYRLLINSGAIARQEFDTRQNALRDAEADVRAAQSQVNSAESQVQSARSQVESAQAGVTAAQQQLEATSSSITTAEARLTQAQVALEGASIYAPFDGVVAYLNYTEGEYFTPQAVSSQLGGDYQGILERIPMVIIDPSQYEVIVDLAGPTGEQVEPNQTAYVASETNIKNNNGGNTTNDSLIANARASGEVFAVNPAISPGGRAIEARIRLNPATTKNIRHGERVLTWIAVEEEPNAIVVPINTVVYRDQTPYVFVVNEKEVVEQRKVELGIRGITQQQIISGVKAGESVITQGQNRLVDGAPVTVINEQ
ncbi:biotin/lipoyl-binding protein [Plectonema cf. radiosum LEGE 06105]|uniref:Biotin/lipoyl-binding protein n=1 Tax=Plectonema cf. radiosum LEGE 06105 TaxID=945769 RepID=A0A8J7K1Q8_9CYAN|nr:biotin/lipoyl-binding protein [Plectonema cf. radiosum LEGE 06105]